MPASSATGPVSTPPPSVDAPSAAAGLGVIRPSADVAWAGLLWTLVRTDFKSRYHGTASGFLWALLKPATIDQGKKAGVDRGWAGDIVSSGGKPISKGSFTVYKVTEKTSFAKVQVSRDTVNKNLQVLLYPPD